MRMQAGERGCKGQLWLMHYSLLAVSTQRQGDCGNFPESEWRTSFCLVTLSLLSCLMLCTACTVRCSSCAIIRPLKWANELTWTRVFSQTRTAWKSPLCPTQWTWTRFHRFKTWWEPAYFFLPFCHPWCLENKEESQVIPRRSNVPLPLQSVYF